MRREIPQRRPFYELKIANRLVQLRKYALSQSKPSRKSSASAARAVSKWERAEASPDTDNLILLSRLYASRSTPFCAWTPPAGRNDGGAPPAQRRRESDEEEDEEEDANAWWKRYPVTRALAACYPILMTALYLALGLRFGRLGWGWLLFLTIPVFYAGASDGFALIAVIAFLAIGLLTHAWAWAWVVLLAIPIFYIAREAYRGVSQKPD